MKKMQLMMSALILSTIGIMPAYADQEACPESAHCAYVSGLPKNNLNEGRYIKLTFGSKNLVACFNSYSTAYIPIYSAGSFVGVHADLYSICKDPQGSQCEPIGIDNYVISEKDKTYYGDPKYYQIDLSKVKDKYPNCAGLGQSFKL